MGRCDESLWVAPSVFAGQRGCEGGGGIPGRRASCHAAPQPRPLRQEVPTHAPHYFRHGRLAGRRGSAELRTAAAQTLHGRPGHARRPRQLLRRRGDESQRVRRRARSAARSADAAANAAANHDRADVRAVPDSAAARRAGLARHHGARLDAHRRRARVDTGRPRGLVPVLRAQGRGDLRRRSVGARAFGVRSVGAERGRGPDAGR